MKSNKFTEWLDSLLPIEQKAVKVTAACSGVFLTVLIGTVITVNVLGATRQSLPSEESSYNSYVSSFPLDEKLLEGTVLAKTKDAGEEYIKDTLFIGDSNTDALYKYGLLPLEQVSAKTGVGVGSAITEKICYFENDTNGYTMVETIAKMKPRRVIFNFGTNNAPYHSTEEFIDEYSKVLKAAKDSYPYADIIVNAVYPIAKSNNYPSISIETIDEYNQALANMCKENGYKFLNTSEILQGEDGYLKSEYANPDGVHLKVDALKNVLTYIREHAYTESKDTRPDTKNIPKRRNTEESQDNSTKEITASYHVEVVEGKTYGTLQGTGFANETSKQFKVTAEQKEFSITAVPNDGYEFVRWSDGVETAARTDKDITKNISVTAIFRSKAALSITASKSEVKSSGEKVDFKATITGGKSGGKISWKLNGVTLSDVSGENVSFNVKPGDKITASMDSISSPVITMKLKAQLSISASAKKCKVGDSVTFTANGDGVDLESVVWKVDGKTQKSGSSFTFRPSAAQTYTISATVGDIATSVQLNVIAAPTPPPVNPPVNPPVPEPPIPPAPEPEPSEPPTPPSSSDAPAPNPPVNPEPEPSTPPEPPTPPELPEPSIPDPPSVETPPAAGEATNPPLEIE